MPQYMNVAKDANSKVKEILSWIEDKGLSVQDERELQILLAQLYNLGIRTSPRPVQGTVRLNAVNQMCAGLSIRAIMSKVRDEHTGKEFNALEFTW